jgi:hypothetical protein
MPLSSSKAVTSRSSGDCSFGRSPSPMNSIQVLPTKLGSEYIDTSGYRKTIIIRCIECIQAIKNYLIFKQLTCDSGTKKVLPLVPKIHDERYVKSSTKILHFKSFSFTNLAPFSFRFMTSTVFSKSIQMRIRFT